MLQTPVGILVQATGSSKSSQGVFTPSFDFSNKQAVEPGVLKTLALVLLSIK